MRSLAGEHRLRAFYVFWVEQVGSRERQNAGGDTVFYVRQPAIAILKMNQFFRSTPVYGFFGLSKVVVDFVFCCRTSSFTQ